MMLGAVGCAAPSSPSSAPAPVPAMAVADEPCAKRDDIVLTTHDVVLSCRVDHRACTGVAEFEVLNCASEPRQVVGLHVLQGSAPTISFAPWDHALSPGADRTKRYEHLPAGRYTLRAEIEVDGVRTMTDAVPFSVHNPARDDARAACASCSGVWGSHGPGTGETCNCATPDAGAFCDDGNDCAGECRFERFHEVRPPTLACPDCDVVLPALGRPVGRCTVRQTSFGCRARVPAGASSDAPVRLPAEPPFECSR